MRTTLKIITMALFATMSMPSFAQKTGQSIAEAFDEFVNVMSKEYYITMSSKENYDKSSFRQYNFAFPAKKRRYLGVGSYRLEKFNQILLQNTKNAERFLSKKTGEKSNITMSVEYGNGRVQKRIEFGVHNDRNYNVVQVKAENDSTMQCVYALVWRNENDSVKGGVYRICEPVFPSKKYNFGTSGNKITIIENTNATNSKIPVDIVPKDGADFMSQLNNLYSFYKQGHSDPSGMIGSSVINRVLRLCKEHHSLLNADEREVCRTILARWKKYCNDYTRRDLLDLSIKYIK